jgi:hypothetical protein
MRARVLLSVLLALNLLVVSLPGQGFNQTHPWRGFSGFGVTGGSPRLLRYPLSGLAGASFRPGLHSGFFFGRQFGFGRRNGFAFASFPVRPTLFHSYFGGIGYPGAIFPPVYGGVPESSATARFVEQWKEPQPLASDWSTVLSESSLLTIGMPEDEIVKVLGSPLEKTSTGTAVIWKYSSLSLRIENGKLSGVR